MRLRRFWATPLLKWKPSLLADGRSIPLGAFSDNRAQTEYLLTHLVSDWTESNRENQSTQAQAMLVLSAARFVDTEIAQDLSEMMNSRFEVEKNARTRLFADPAKRLKDRVIAIYNTDLTDFAVKYEVTLRELENAIRQGVPSARMAANGMPQEEFDKAVSMKQEILRRGEIHVQA